MGTKDPILLFAYRKPPVLYVRLVGSLTMQNFEGVLQSFNELFNEPPQQLYIMMRDVRYLDSAGLGMFVRLNTRCRALKCSLTLLEPNTEVSRLFNLSKLDLIMPIERGVAANQARDAYEDDSHFVELPRTP